MQWYDQISLMTAAKVKISREKKKEKNPAELDPPLRFVRPEWFSHPMYWCPRDEFFCLHHDQICEQVESVLRVLDPNYSFPHLEEEEKKNKQEDEQSDMDLSLFFEEEKEVEEEEVRSQQLGGKFEEPQEGSLKKSESENKNKNKKKKKNNNKKKNKKKKKKKKKQENDMEVDYSNIQKNKEQEEKGVDYNNIQMNEEQEEKKKDAIIIKYRPPPKDHPWNIQEGQKYDVIPLLLSKLRDFLIKYIWHQVRPQQLGGKLEEPQEESNKKRKKKKKKKKQRQENDMEEDNNNNIQKNKEQKDGEKKDAANTINYQPPSKNRPWTIQEGEKYDIKPLLFSKLRDYLIKYNGHQVKCQQLKDKYILLYFWWLSDDRLTLHEDGICFGSDEYLGEIYRANNPKGNFEVVFIALGNNESAFRDSFSCMPWLAIPHEDQEGRDLFIKIFDIPSSPSVSAVLFAPDGTALCTNPQYTFCANGPDGFPFTDRRLSQMRREHFALLKEFILKKQKPSLTALFGDYLISSEEMQVRTSVLEDKIVGLYFIGTSPVDFQSAEKLLNIWKFMKTSEAYKNFEIVLVNKAFDGNLQLAKARFKAKFGDIPWYSLPLIYNKKCCEVFWNNIIQRKMKEGFFIVLEPDRYQCLSYFALGILNKFGIDAYPFTLEKAVIVEKSIQRKQLVLSQLLSPLAPLRRGGSTCNNEEDTTVSTLSGKPVLLLFGTDSCYECGSFLPKLKKMYDENKGTDDHFEVIYISLDCVETPSSFPRGIQRMPWLIHAYAPRFAEDLAVRVFQIFPRLPAIAAFGPNGYLETKESNLAFKEVWNSKYPFIQSDMDEEVCRELMDMYNWDLEDLFPSILTKRKLDVPRG